MQRTVELLSTEAECMDLSDASQEEVWLKMFLCELGEVGRNQAVMIYEDK